MISFNLTYHLKFPVSNIVTWGVRAPTYKFGGTQFSPYHALILKRKTVYKENCRWNFLINIDTKISKNSAIHTTKSIPWQNEVYSREY